MSLFVATRGGRRRHFHAAAMLISAMPAGPTGRLAVKRGRHMPRFRRHLIPALLVAIRASREAGILRLLAQPSSDISHYFGDAIDISSRD